MNKSAFYKEYESYLNEYKNRGFLLAWIKLCKVQNSTVPSNLNFPSISIPPKHVVEDELLSALKESDHPTAYVQFFHLYLKNMIIPESDLNFIDESDHRLIYWLLFSIDLIQNSQHLKSIPTYTIHNEAIYTDLIIYINNQKKFINLPQPYSFINMVSKNSFYVIWKTVNPIINFPKYDYQTLITKFDLMELNLTSKLNLIQNSFNNFKNFKSADNEISWIKPTENKQIAWCINYLKKFNFYNFSVFEYSDVSPYEQILITLDSISPSQIIQRTIFIEKMKKSWTQQKYREAGKIKTNYHLPLTKDCKDKLKKLSELMNMSENKLLERLINEKYDLEATDENGKFKF